MFCPFLLLDENLLCILIKDQRIATTIRGCVVVTVVMTSESLLPTTSGPPSAKNCASLFSATILGKHTARVLHFEIDVSNKSNARAVFVVSRSSTNPFHNLVTS